jgi:hypothetical protein
MENKTGTYVKAILLTAVIVSLIFSISLLVPNAYARPGHVESGGPSNTSTTSIPQTTSTIPQSNSIGSNTPGAPNVSINITYSKTYTVILNGKISAGTNNTTIKWVNVTWGDGVKTANVILPVNHTYGSTGTFLITATAYQSNGQTNSAAVSALISTPSNSTTAPATTTILPVANTTTAPSSNASTVAPTTTLAQQSGSSGNSNTLLYVAIIIVVIIIILIAAWALMKKK